MGQEPEAIRQEIEQTRERMGETVDALGYKVDIPGRAKESITGKVDTVKSKIGEIGSGMSAAAPQPEDLRQGAKQMVGAVRANPLGLAIGAAAAGFLAGMLIPNSRIEDERIGPVADQVKEHAMQTGQEALHHGKQVAQETATVATEKAQEAVAEVKDQAQESAQSHAREVSESARDSAEHVQQTANTTG
jgi:gas vesicle protein